MKAPARKRVTFSIKANAESNVSVAGSFNDWSDTKTQLKTKSGLFSKSMLLERGRYEYKFVVDGTWMVDPACADWAPNGHGSLNSVIDIS
jgi:1,4-alpha-glucan branching enzyme